MKRLNTNVSRPEGPVPEAYKDDTKDIPIELDVLEINPIQEEHVVPPKSVYSYNLKKIKSFKQIRRKYKMSNQSQVFLKDLSLILGEYSPQNHQLDKELLLHVLNISEAFFIYGDKKERNELKENAVRVLMQPYFRDDGDILEVMISSVWSKVKKTNCIKRLIKRISNKFFLN
jgi:hypothetical protein